jgi:uncharacterized 2Fe-2S/4Fe-4S cluster protein (DUF4445 family)
MEFVIKFQPIGRRLVCTQPTALYAAARLAGVELKSLCGGVGNCGKCRVKVSAFGQQALTPLTDEERLNLTSDEIADGYRQACRVSASGDVTVYLPASSLTEKQKLLVGGEYLAVEVNPPVRKVFLQLMPPSLEDVRGDLQRVNAALQEQGLPPLRATPPVLEMLSRALRRGDWNTTLTRAGAELVAAEPGDTRQKLLGLAVDLGTTKIAVFLVDLLNGATLGSKGVMNPQIAYGEDVISRIQAALDEQVGAERMQALVVQAINAASASLLHSAGLQAEDLTAISLVGNTAMHHLFLRLPVRQLAVSPFIPATSGAMMLWAREVGLQAAPGAPLYLLPPIAGFVGSDHTAALLACHFHDSPGNALLLDIGTNTEIALRAHRKLYSCSCASGPAFEGAHIQHGMRAAPGAVEQVSINQQDLSVQYTTIDDQPPVGICGSGILDAVAEMARVGILRANGHLRKNMLQKDGPDGVAPAFTLAEWQEGDQRREVAITQQDVVEIQLAKGAIRAGAEVLLEEAGLAASELDQVIIAGAFGRYLDPLNALRIGLLPPVPLERIRQVGNAAGVGARLALTSQRQWEAGIELAQNIRYLELTTHPSFRRRFKAALHF